MIAHASSNARWKDWLLGVQPMQRLRASLLLLALCVSVVFAGVQHLEVAMGMIDASESWRLTAWNLSGALLFYLVARGEWSLRRISNERLTVAATLWAMLSISWSYAITGPARGAVILIMVLVILFGAFALSPRYARLLTCIGFLMLGSVMLWKAGTDPRRYDPRVEAMHMGFAGIVMTACVALSVHLGRLRKRLELALERIRAVAFHDELTGLTNRRAALDRMRGEFVARDHPSPPMSLVLMDIDHFKRVNDKHGHAAGDAVLRRFAESALTEVRSGDMLARWGGEEFLLVLPATSPAQAKVVLERMRLALRRRSFDDIAPGLEITFSAGLAEGVGMHDVETTIARADAAMYEAKRSGRDRVVTCSQTAGDVAGVVGGSVAVAQDTRCSAKGLSGQPQI